MIEQSTYVSDILPSVASLARHHDNRSPNIGGLDSLSITSKRSVVNEREVIVRLRRVSDLEVSDLGATSLGQSVRDAVSGILLSQNGSTEQCERSESKERHGGKRM